MHQKQNHNYTSLIRIQIIVCVLIRPTISVGSEITTDTQPVYVDSVQHQIEEQYFQLYAV